MGVNVKGFTFDYAYHTYAELSELTTHFFSIGWVGEAKAAVVQAPAPTPVPVITPAAVKPAPKKKK
jgi:hypothetical protein